MRTFTVAQVRMCRDRLLVERDLPEEERSPGGMLIVPKGTAEAPLTATVHAVGPEVTGVAPRSVVLVGKYAGQPVRVEGREMAVIGVEDVLGVVEGG